jgi:hypothetical protein
MKYVFKYECCFRDSLMKSAWSNKPTHEGDSKQLVCARNTQETAGVGEDRGTVKISC